MDEPQAPPPATLAPDQPPVKEAVAEGLPGPAMVLEPEDWTTAKGRECADKRLIMYVNGLDTDDVRDFGRKVSQQLNLMLIDLTSVEGDGRGPAVERLTQVVKDLKGHVAAVVATPVPFGPADTGDPASGVMIALSPMGPRGKAERTFLAEPDSFVDQPSWLKNQRRKGG